MSDDEFEEVLNQTYPGGRQTQPGYWNDDAYNNPSQPVVGICWHEARAYCAWLSVETGESFRLPTEVEWEAAARGFLGRRHAYGDEYDAACCNTFETRIRRTTPIGMFPGGETLEPGGIAGMTGNVWDWTSSLYKPYPYDPTDGGEEPVADDSSGRVLRGGSWDDDPIDARATVRDHDLPADRGGSIGFRVWCSSHIFVPL